jgi:hypothetical protein
MFDHPDGGADVPVSRPLCPSGSDCSTAPNKPRCAVRDRAQSRSPRQQRATFNFQPATAGFAGYVKEHPENPLPSFEFYHSNFVILSSIIPNRAAFVNRKDVCVYYPKGVKSFSPALTVRAVRLGPGYAGLPSPKSSTLKELDQSHDRIEGQRGLHQSPLVLRSALAKVDAAFSSALPDHWGFTESAFSRTISFDSEKTFQPPRLPSYLKRVHIQSASKKIENTNHAMEIGLHKIHIEGPA